MTSDWQRIETAPKDGTPILAYDTLWGGPRFYVTRWSDAATHEPTWNDGDEYTQQPTHWMPLPEAPHD